MRILVTGSRDWDDYGAVCTAIIKEVMWHQQKYDLDGPVDWVVVVHGACPTGADDMADDFTRRVVNWKVERHPADWQEFSRSAGPIRNQKMVDRGADVCIAFIKNRSRGATGCADMAERAGIRTVRYTPDDLPLVLEAFKH